MERLGVLPAPQDVYPGGRILLFGLLSRLAKSHEEYHFGLDSIVENQFIYHGNAVLRTYKSLPLFPLNDESVQRLACQSIGRS